MRNRRLLTMAGLLVFSHFAMAQKNYPATRKSDVQDTYFGTTVNDPYRWLEDDNSAETKAWVTEQNKVTNAYLEKIPFRSKIKDRLEVLWNYAKESAPYRKGAYYYYSKNTGLQNQSVYYRRKGMNGAEELVLDPNKLSEDGTAALGSFSLSKNGKYLAYTVAQSGSDWSEAYVMNVDSKELLKEKIQWIKFSGLSWNGDEGFYYSRYPEPDASTKLSRQNQFHKVYYHKVGTPQSEDVLIYEDNDHPLRNTGGSLTDDGRFLIISLTEGTSGRELWVKDMKQANAKLTLLIPGFKNEASVIDNIGDKLLVRTNIDAPNYKVVLIDPKAPAKENWKTVIPEQKEVLQGVGNAGKQLFASYLKDASSKVVQYDYTGKKIRDIVLPGIGTVSGFGGEEEDKMFYYSFSSYSVPPSIYSYDIATGKSTLYKTSAAKVNSSQYETKQVFFTSKDGAKVPMFLTYKKGIQLNGNNPVLIYGYGGFNIPQTPGFSISNYFFIEQGGIYAVVNLRGGSEYGEDWHKAGMLQNKQNVFNDFIGAAEYLIANKYTNNKRIAIRGGSNGGLLVGACMTQRPDLFAVAIPQVGVMDMLRFHRFTIGWAWAVEYGNAEKNEADFKNLYGYSPLHNIKSGTCYPATLVTTADHDDRVVPAHSFKFAATLQEAQSCDKPTLIRIESKAGHGAGKPTSKQIEEAADIWSFVMYNLGMNF